MAMTGRRPALLVRAILSSGVGLGEEVVDACFGGDGPGGQRLSPVIITVPNAHRPQLVEARAHAVLDDVFEMDHPEGSTLTSPMVELGDAERCSAVAGDAGGDRVERLRDGSTGLQDPPLDGVGTPPCGCSGRRSPRPLNCTRLGGEPNECSVEQLDRDPAIRRLRQGHDRAALRCLIGEARRDGLRRASCTFRLRQGDELRRLAVAVGYRAGLVEQQRVDVHRPPRRRGSTSPAHCAGPGGPCRRCRSPTAGPRSSSGSGTRARR